MHLFSTPKFLLKLIFYTIITKNNNDNVGNISINSCILKTVIKPQIIQPMKLHPYETQISSELSNHRFRNNNLPPIDNQQTEWNENVRRKRNVFVLLCECVTFVESYVKYFIVFKVIKV